LFAKKSKNIKEKEKNIFLKNILLFLYNQLLHFNIKFNTKIFIIQNIKIYFLEGFVFLIVPLLHK